jgi:hypothetical protein
MRYTSLKAFGLTVKYTTKAKNQAQSHVITMLRCYLNAVDRASTDSNPPLAGGSGWPGGGHIAGLKAD